LQSASPNVVVALSTKGVSSNDRLGVALSQREQREPPPSLGHCYRHRLSTLLAQIVGRPLTVSGLGVDEQGGGNIGPWGKGGRHQSVEYFTRGLIERPIGHLYVSSDYSSMTNLEMDYCGSPSIGGDRNYV
jgi:hypothetical protein